jgi:hypothetical protein
MSFNKLCISFLQVVNYALALVAKGRLQMKLIKYMRYKVDVVFVGRQAFSGIIWK